MRWIYALTAVFFCEVTQTVANGPNLELGKAAIENTLQLMYHRYGMDLGPWGKHVLGVYHSINEKTWDMYKYKFATKMLMGNGTMRVIFGGSSVTAGHDNFLWQAYPQVYERRLRPAFEALGINFEVRNIAMGEYIFFV